MTSIRNFHRKRPAKWIVEALILLVLYLAIRTWMQRDVIEGPMPPITTVTLAGEKIDLRQKPSQPYLLHIWASWCGICRFEQGSIESINADHTVLTLAMQSGTDAEVRAYLQGQGLSFKVINDPDGILSQQFGIRGVPASFIVNTKGEIVFAETGYTSEWGLRLRLWLAK